MGSDIGDSGTKPSYQQRREQVSAVLLIVAFAIAVGAILPFKGSMAVAGLAFVLSMYFGFVA